MVADATGRADPLARRVLWLTGVGHASSHSWELIFPAVAVPMARDLGLSFEDTVTLSFTLYLLYGLGAPAAGWLADRFGARVVLIAGLLGGGLSGLAVAFASTGVALQVALGGLGLAASLYHPSGLALLSLRFEKIGRAFAINGMAGNVGIAATPILAGLIASTLGWRWSYALLCAPGLLFGGLFLFLPTPSEPGVGFKASGRADRGTDWRSLIAMAVAVTAGGLTYRLHTLIMPALLAERVSAIDTWTAALGLSALDSADNLAATALTSVAYAVGLGGQWLGGRLADGRPLASSYLGFHVVCLPLILFAAFATDLPLVLAVFAYIFFAIGMQPVENSLVAALTPVAWRGRAYAGKFVLSFGVGAMGSYIVGWVSPYGGLGASLATAAGFELVLIAAIVVIWRLDVAARRASA